MGSTIKSFSSTQVISAYVDSLSKHTPTYVGFEEIATAGLRSPPANGSQEMNHEIDLLLSLQKSRTPSDLNEIKVQDDIC